VFVSVIDQIVLVRDQRSLAGWIDFFYVVVGFEQEEGRGGEPGD
jgi:hypothetical protein